MSGICLLIEMVIWSTFVIRLISLMIFIICLMGIGCLIDYHCMIDLIIIFTFSKVSSFAIIRLAMGSNSIKSSCISLGFVMSIFLTYSYQLSLLEFIISILLLLLSHFSFLFEFMPSLLHLLLIFCDHLNNYWMIPYLIQASAQLFTILFYEVLSFIKISLFSIVYGRSTFEIIKFISFY